MHLYDDGALYARRAVELARTLHAPGKRLAMGLSFLANAFRFQGDLPRPLSTLSARRASSPNKSFVRTRASPY